MGGQRVYADKHDTPVVERRLSIMRKPVINLGITHAEPRYTILFVCLKVIL